MPHSSRRKKPPPTPFGNKLVNVAIDDGWATVSRKANADRIPRKERSVHGEQAEYSHHGRKSLGGPPVRLLERLTYDQARTLAVHLPTQDGGVDLYTVPPLQADLSKAQITKGYEDKAGNWRVFHDAKQVENILYKRVGEAKLCDITKAVCLGSGSFSSLQQATSSQWQIAAFVEVVKMLNNMKGHGREIKLYAQDPAYNTVDRHLLDYLGVEVLETPAACALCDETTFVFAPHVQLTLWTSDMRMGKTALIVGNDVDKFIDKLASESEIYEYFHSILPNHTSMHIPDASIKEDFKHFVSCKEQAVWPSISLEGQAAFHDLKFYWTDDQDGQHDDCLEPVRRAVGDMSVVE